MLSQLNDKNHILMSIIAKIKNLISKDNVSENLSSNLIGLRIFHSGVLLLASAPAIAFFLLLISSIFGGFNRGKNYFQDKYNFPFILVSVLMIINCIFITIKSGNNSVYINLYQKISIEPDITNVWVGLSNWIPFFWCFWAFQPFLKDQRLRIKTSKLLIFGSLPVILSGFCQYFLKMYGPYYFLNNLIIWYQRPLKDGAITGLFNNPNYAAAWLCIIFPLCLAFLILNKKNNIKNLFILLLCLNFITMIILTTSRSAILSIFISIFFLTKSIKAKSYLLLTIFSIPILLNLVPTFSLNLQSIIHNFLPFGLIKKASLINISNSELFPRLEIWGKSIELIKANLLTGYGAGSFQSLYILSDGIYRGIQHSHNIF